MESKNNNSTSIGFVGLLQLLFIALKLLGKINWSWWIVMLPFEISFVIIIVLVTIMIIVNKK